MAKAKFKVGRTYYGPGDQRRTVVEIDGKKVRVIRPITFIEEVMTVAEMNAFMGESSRRTYHHREGEVRTKIAETDETVTYDEPHFRGTATIPRAEWLDWRKGAKD